MRSCNTAAHDAGEGAGVPAGFMLRPGLVQFQGPLPTKGKRMKFEEVLPELRAGGVVALGDLSLRTGWPVFPSGRDPHSPIKNEPQLLSVGPEGGTAPHVLTFAELESDKWREITAFSKPLPEELEVDVDSDAN